MPLKFKCIVDKFVISASFDPYDKAYDKHTMMRSMVAVFTYLLHDESIQVSGMVYFLDMSGYEKKHEKYLTMSDLRQLYDIWQVCSILKAVNIWHGFRFKWVLVVV